MKVQGGCCACSDAYHFAMQLHSVSSACSENYDLSMQLHKCANLFVTYSQTACSSVFQAASCSLRCYGLASTSIPLANNPYHRAARKKNTTSPSISLIGHEQACQCGLRLLVRLVRAITV